MFQRIGERGTKLAVAGFGGLLLSLFVLIPLARGAAQSAETYKLSAVRFSYPYDDPRESVKPDDHAAAVTFDAEWVGDRYPGPAECDLTAFGASGEQVGQVRFSLDSGTNGGSSTMTLAVDSEPVSGNATCTKSPDVVTSDGPGYEFIGPTKITDLVDPHTGEAVGRTDLGFDVRWTIGGAEPSFRTCYLTVERSDGSTDEPHKYNVMTGPGPLSLDVPGYADSIVDAQMSCGPFEG